MRRNKNNLLIVIGIIIVIAIVAIVGIILFLTTDMFKGNQETFFKYIMQNGELMDIIDNTSNYSEDLKQSKYTTDGEITFNLISNNPEVANQTIPARNFKINYTAKTDNTLNRTSSEATIKYLTKDLFTLKYIKNEDIYALKSDEVINKYLAFENNNLKDLAQKLGVQDVTSIPNKIENINIKELLYISEQDKQTILTKYMQIINSEIPKDAYTKKKNVDITIKENQLTTNAYTLTLTEAQANNIKKVILQTLKDDEFTLNILLSKINMLSINIDINTLKENIQSIINGLDGSSNSGDIQLTVYERNRELVRTEYSDVNGKIVIDYTKTADAKSVLITNTYEMFKEHNEVENVNNIDDNTYANIEDINENDIVQNNDNALLISSNNNIKLKTIEIAKQKTNNAIEQVAIFTLNINDKIIKVAIQSKTNNNLNEGNIDNKVVINTNISDETYFTINVTQAINISNDIEVEELNNTNSAKVNDFTAEYTMQLTNAIISRLQQLLQQKTELVTIVQQQENEQQQNQEVQNTNENNTINTDNSI